MLEKIMELGTAAGKTLHELANAQNTDGHAPLAMACKVGNVAIVRYLVTQCDADVWLQACAMHSAAPTETMRWCRIETATPHCTILRT